jgi:hypothetical protein
LGIDEGQAAALLSVCYRLALLVRFGTDEEVLFNSPSLYRRMAEIEIRKQARSAAGKKAASLRWDDSIADANAMRTQCERNANAQQVLCDSMPRKGKERKGKDLSSSKNPILNKNLSDQPSSADSSQLSTALVVSDESGSENSVNPDAIKRAPQIYITDDSWAGLLVEYGAEFLQAEVKKASDYCKAKGKRYVDHAAFIRNWMVRAAAQNNRQSQNRGFAPAAAVQRAMLTEKVYEIARQKDLEEALAKGAQKKLTHSPKGGLL